MASDAMDTTDQEPSNSREEPDSEASGESEEVYEVESIYDVRKEGRKLQFKVHWKGYPPEKDTWEDYTSLKKSGPAVVETLEEFKRTSEKAQGLMPRPRGRPSKKTWEYVVENVGSNPTDDSIVDRELRPDDDFFGERASEVTGEKKKLYDPSHKTSSTELFLARVNTSERVTRQAMKKLTGLKEDEENHDEEKPAARRTARGTGGSRQKRTASKRTKGHLRDSDYEDNADASFLSATNDGECSSSNSLATTEENSLDSFNGAAQSLTLSTTETGVTEPVSTEESLPEEHRVADNHYYEDDEEDDLPEQDEVGNMEGLPKAEILERPNWVDELRVRTYVEGSEIDVTQEDIIDIVQRCDLRMMEKVICYYKGNLREKLLYTEPHTEMNFLHKLCKEHTCKDSQHYPDDMIKVICRAAGTAYRKNLLAQTNQEGQTPLHLAVANGMCCHVTALLKYKAQLELENLRKQKALHIAYERNHASMVRKLLAAGANFGFLEHEELEKPENKRKGRAFNALRQHSQQMSRLLFTTRNTVYTGLEEVEAISPIFTINSSTKIAFFKFKFEPYAIPSGEYTYMTFFFLCDLNEDFSKSTARCWGDVHFADGYPKFNGESMEKVQESNTPMVFYCCPDTVNEIEIKLSKGCPLVIAVQVVLVKLYQQEVQKIQQPDENALEYAPLVGPV